MISAGQDAVASDFISTSAGAGDSGKAPKLNGSGKLDLTFLDNHIGDSSDGAFSQNAGTTTWNTAGKSVYQFSSFALTGTAVLTLGSNLQNKRIIVLVDGDLTITSGAAKAINLDGLGGLGGTGVAGGSGNSGGNGIGVAANTSSGGVGGGAETGSPTLYGAGGGGAGSCVAGGTAGQAGTGGSGGVAGAAGATPIFTSLTSLSNSLIFSILAPGSGGGAGGGTSGGDTGGAGGNGGGCIIFIVKGNINITATFSSLGAAGSPGTSVSGPNYYSGGGGGGAGGSFGIFYCGTVVANSATFNVTAGNGDTTCVKHGGNGAAGTSIVRQISLAVSTCPLLL